MARIKKIKGQTPVSKELKKKLTTKRNYSSNKNVEENLVPSNQRRYARKCIVDGNNFREQKGRKSIEGSYAHKTTHGRDASPGIETSKNVPVKVKKTRKSGIHLRPLVVSHRNHHRKSGVLALQQIRYYQKEVGLLMPKLNFQRVVREILNDFTSMNYRIQREALVALQEAAEMYLVRKFEDSQLCAIHANRVTVMIRDFTLLKSLQD